MRSCSSLYEALGPPATPLLQQAEKIEQGKLAPPPERKPARPLKVRRGRAALGRGPYRLPSPTQAASVQCQPGPTPPRPHRPPQALAVNSWVLALMLGIVAVIIAGKGRIHVPEPLARVHATDGVLPFVMPLESDSV